MPRSAYPVGYNLGPDNRGWLMELKNKIQVRLTGGPRVYSGFWKFREFPLTLLALKGKGEYRFEGSKGEYVQKGSDKYGVNSKSILFYLDAAVFHGGRDYVSNGKIGPAYLSRIQPWTRWHVALMWPLGIHWSFIYRARNVARYPKYQSDFGIKNLFCGYFGWVRDSDRIYKPKLFVGGNFE